MNILKKKTQQLIALSFIVFSVETLAGESISQRLSVNEATNISIENHSGSVKVVGWNEAEVFIEGKLDDRAEKLIFEQRGSQIYIKVEYPNMNNWASQGSDLTIFTPKATRVDVSGVSSSVELTLLSGGVEAKTVSGDIFVRDLTEHIELSTISGNIASTKLSGKISLSTVSGDITDKASTGRLQLQSVSGAIELESLAAEIYVNNVSGSSKLKLADVIELRISTVSGDVNTQLQLKDKGLIKATSVSGDLDFFFGENVNANFSLKYNVGGDLINKLTDDKAEHAKYGPGAKLYFHTGNGNASVSANTVSGNIKVAGK